MANTHDFAIQNEGTIFLLTPWTPAAQGWIAEHLPEDATHFGASVVVEHRFIRDILAGIVNGGLTVTRL